MKYIIEKLPTIKNNYKTANQLYNNMINSQLCNGNVVNNLLGSNNNTKSHVCIIT